VNLQELIGAFQGKKVKNHWSRWILLLLRTNSNCTKNHWRVR